MGKVDDWLACLIPRRCVLCHAPSGTSSVCAGCCDDLPWLAPGCTGCGAPLPEGLSPPRCLRCSGGRPAPVRIRAALAYAYPVDRMITRAKFHGQLYFARALGELLAGRLPALALAGEPLPDLLVPMPLHRRRLAERGYNQALEMSYPVAEALRLKPAIALCRRQRETREQSGLSASARRVNVRGAFTVSGDCRGARIAVIDDVVTTGSTAAALALALRRAGALRVEIWAVARTL